MNGQSFEFVIQAKVVTVTRFESRSIWLTIMRTTTSKDVSWCDIDTSKFLLYSNSFLFAGRLVSYPAFVFKTRMQYATQSVSSVSATIRKEGFRGVYRGFTAIAIGLIPSQTTYYCTFEFIRAKAIEWVDHVRVARENGLTLSKSLFELFHTDSNFKHRLTPPKVLSAIEPSILISCEVPLYSVTSQQMNHTNQSTANTGFAELALVNLLAGSAASIASQIFVVPVEVVSQRMIVQRISRSERSDSLFGIVRSLAKTEGFRGFYRGVVASSITYSTSSALWWVAYSTIKHRLAGRSELSPSATVITSGFLASVSSIMVTHPMDVVKTQIQTVAVADRQHSLWRTGYTVIVNEGVRYAFTKGLGARLMNTVPVSVLMITAYEAAKRLSVKQK